jgi:hypothetical protein
MLNRRPHRLLAVSLLALSACETFGHRGTPPPLPSNADFTFPGVTPVEPGPVTQVAEELVIAAWAEPARLPKGGGQAQLLIRVQKRGGARFPGVEVSLGASAGSLYSGGHILVTDAQGMTRDRLSAARTVTVTLNAGGTRYRFLVPVGEEDHR